MVGTCGKGTSTGTERSEGQWLLAPRPTSADVVGELCQRSRPDPAGLRLLGACAGQCSLRRDEIEDGADAGAIADPRRDLGPGGACQQYIRGAGALSRRLQCVVRGEDLLTHLGAKEIGACRRPVFIG